MATEPSLSRNTGLPGNQVFGGIQDLHYEQKLGKDVQFTLDGHAIFDTNDFGIEVDLSKAKLGYVRFGYEGFRSWYDGNGGFFHPMVSSLLRVFPRCISTGATHGSN
jgi:hypothetical protein